MVVINVKFTHGFTLDRKLKNFITFISRKISISQSRRNQQYLSVYYSFTKLEPGSDLVRSLYL